MKVYELLSFVTLVCHNKVDFIRFSKDYPVSKENPEGLTCYDYSPLDLLDDEPLYYYLEKEVLGYHFLNQEEKENDQHPRDLNIIDIQVEELE